LHILRLLPGFRDGSPILPASLPWEEIRMYFFEPLPFDVRIDLRCRNVGMSEHRLHRSKIRTSP